MGLVRIKHPTLDDGRVVKVPEESLIHHLAAGWVRADEPTPESVPAETPASPVADEPELPKRRGRINKESE